MGNIIASGGGDSLKVGKNCEKLTNFTSDIVIEFSGIILYKVVYNNSLFGKACLAATEVPDASGSIVAQNKDYNYEWNFFQEDEETFLIVGNITKKCDKNSVAAWEILEVTPTLEQSQKDKLKAVSKKPDEFKKLLAKTPELSNKLKALRSVKTVKK